MPQGLVDATVDERDAGPARRRLPRRHLHRHADIIPLTGAPTTELRGVHAPFVSPVFYPMRMWTPNYFGELDGYRRDEPHRHAVQHRSDPANAEREHPPRLRRPGPAPLLRRRQDTATGYAGARSPTRRRSSSVETADGADLVFAPGRRRPEGRCPRGVGRLDRRDRRVGPTRPPAVHRAAACVMRRARRLARLDRHASPALRPVSGTLSRPRTASAWWLRRQPRLVLRRLDRRDRRSRGDDADPGQPANDRHLWADRKRHRRADRTGPPWRRAGPHPDRGPPAFGMTGPDGRVTLRSR